MLFILILASFTLIGLIAFRGDYKSREIQQDYDYYKKIIGDKDNER